MANNDSIVHNSYCIATYLYRYLFLFDSEADLLVKVSQISIDVIVSEARTQLKQLGCVIDRARTVNY